jgi:hypothetical protein
MTFNFPLGLRFFIIVINFKGTKPFKKIECEQHVQMLIFELLYNVFFYYADSAFSAFLYVRMIEIFRHTFQCRYY